MPFIIFVLAIGLYYTVRSGFFSIVHFPYIMKNTIFKMNDKESNQTSDGTISSFAAVATGCPGAVFWMIVRAFFGMMVKVVEVTLGCYYRNKGDDGKYYGGATFIIEKGIDWDNGKHYGVYYIFSKIGHWFVMKPPAFLFSQSPDFKRCLPYYILLIYCSYILPSAVC
jgi:Na+/alanine symporter